MGNRYDWLEKELLDNPGAERDYKAEWSWHRWLVGGKMFAAVCSPGPEHGIYGGRKLLTLKCEPMLSELMRKEYEDILPGFYMNKQNWISIFLDGEVPDGVLRDLCGRSYRLVFEKLTKKAQREILSGREKE
ncbi:MAG: MmcQ/YjbR family DNA-binding protein [Oscillospiraceae bacterium]|jgi:predicted DNA-binding protein (MmcQ/YjbR family)|nr:MmcQ/YjbR family DNA-binding protein [Oscillospiraceae bacterium]